MIVLKILLWILLAVLGLILLVLVLPVGAEVSYIDKKLSFKVKYWFINIMDSGGGGVLGWLKKRKGKPKKPKSEKKKKKNGKVADVPQPDEISEPVQAADETVQECYEPENAPVTENDQTEQAADCADIPDISDDLPDDDPLFTGETEHKGKKKKDKKKSESDESAGGKKEKKSLTDKIEFIIGIWEQSQRPLLKIFKGFHLNDVFIDFIIANEDAHKCAVTYGRMCAAIYNGLAKLSEIFTVRLKTVDVNCGFALDKSRWDVGLKLKFRPGTVVIAGLWFLITYIFKVFIPDKLRGRKAKKAAAKQ